MSNTGTRTASRVWHAGLALVVLAALGVQIAVLVSGGADVNATGASTAHVDLGTRFIRLFSYFTIQSNLVVLCVAMTLAMDPDRDGPVWRVLRLDALLGIAITGIVFAAILSRQVHHTGVGVWVNAGFHQVSPVATLLGWLLFGPRLRITRHVVAWAFAWPVAWVGFTLVRGALTGWYPYPFLDVGVLGYGKVAVNVSAVLGLALVLALGLLGLERWWGRASPAGRRAHAGPHGHAG